MTIRGKLIGMILVGVLFAGLSAHGQDVHYVGLYAPNVPFGSSASRITLIRKVAGALTTATGAAFRGQNFASAGPLKSWISSGKLGFAIIDAFFLADHAGFKPLASLRGPTGTAEPMSLFVARGYRSVADLKGKTIIMTGASKRAPNLYSNYLLEAEVNARKYFGRIKTAGSISSAMAAVKSGGADGVFAYQSAGRKGGLKEILRGKNVPWPVVVVTRDDVPADLVAKVKGALGGIGGSEPVKGFAAYDGAAMSKLRGMMGAVVVKYKKPVMVRPKAERIAWPKERLRLIDDYALPSLADHFVKPLTKGK